MSTITVTNIKATGETASRAATGVAASYAQVDGDPVGLNASFNVASATDVATGRFDIAFTNNMSATTYTVTAETDLQAIRVEAGTITASGFRVTTELTSGADHDATYAMFATFGDLT